MAKLPWWQTAIIYQIYPRSFSDSNGDGVGDLSGITSRLDYLPELGVDAIWISPIFKSPMKDFGYDIADYQAIEPLFGSMADFDDLLASAHARGLRVILDFVPNHTSDQHPWFLASRSSKTDPKRDWYLWRDPAPDGGPPNNWLSEFGGSAWQFDEHTGQYYYHAFLAAQPDLNWRNPAVVEAMHDVLRFWLRKGVDGFRVDVIWLLIKDAEFRDNPPNPDYGPGKPPHQKLIPLYTTDMPEVHQVIAGMRRVVDEFQDRLLIGEIYLPIDRLVTYYGHDLDGAHLPFNFSLLNTAWDGQKIAKLVSDYEAALPHGGWPNWVLGNHDQPRIASRVGAGASGGRRDVAANVARDADALLRRRTRACRRQKSRLTAYRIPLRRTCRGSASAATDAARRCSGTHPRTQASRPASRGCRWTRAGNPTTSPISGRTRRQS